MMANVRRLAISSAMVTRAGNVTGFCGQARSAIPVAEFVRIPSRGTLTRSATWAPSFPRELPVFPIADQSGTNGIFHDVESDGRERSSLSFFRTQHMIVGLLLKLESR